jgi:hypothetical protein
MTTIAQDWREKQLFQLFNILWESASMSPET